MPDAKFISCADTAKLVRAALKAAFPAVAFSVRSKTYSGGASITIYWTDGPSDAEVNRAVHVFEGADFDGNQDCKIYRRAALLPTGEYIACTPATVPPGAVEVHFRADFIFTSRTYTRHLLEKAAARAASIYHIQPPTVDEHPTFGADYVQDRHLKVDGSNFSASELARQIAHTASRAGNVIVYPKG